MRDELKQKTEVTINIQPVDLGEIEAELGAIKALRKFLAKKEK